jgi:glycosyltransferase involved in cell wall biosynthesis
MRVGVVIPSYNHERYVGDAVRSVLGQSVDDVELVVIDDGSKDDSASVIRDAFLEFPDRKTTIIEQPNAGAHAAIMRGVEQLDTEVVAILNSDDTYHPDRFERVLPWLAEKEHGIAFTGINLFDAHGDTLPAEHAWPKWYSMALGAAETEPTIGFALMVQNFSVTSGNFVFTRALYNELGGFGNQKFAHDWDFLIRSIWHTEPMMINERLMSYRVHDSNTTDSVRSLLKSECGGTLQRYLEMCKTLGPPANELAPHPDHWPEYFHRFVKSRAAYWDKALSAHPLGQMTGTS